MGNTFPIMNAKSERPERRIPEIQNKTTPKGDLVFGDPAGIRTPDPLLKRQLLCLLSY